MWSELRDAWMSWCGSGYSANMLDISVDGLMFSVAATWFHFGLLLSNLMSKRS